MVTATTGANAPTSPMQKALTCTLAFTVFGVVGFLFGAGVSTLIGHEVSLLSSQALCLEIGAGTAFLTAAIATGIVYKAMRDQEKRKAQPTPPANILPAATNQRSDREDESEEDISPVAAKKPEVPREGESEEKKASPTDFTSKTEATRVPKESPPTDLTVRNLAQTSPSSTVQSTATKENRVDIIKSAQKAFDDYLNYIKGTVTIENVRNAAIQIDRHLSKLKKNDVTIEITEEENLELTEEYKATTAVIHAKVLNEIKTLAINGWIKVESQTLKTYKIRYIPPAVATGQVTEQEAPEDVYDAIGKAQGLFKDVEMHLNGAKQIDDLDKKFEQVDEELLKVEKLQVRFPAWTKNGGVCVVKTSKTGADYMKLVADYQSLSGKATKVVISDNILDHVKSYFNEQGKTLKSRTLQNHYVMPS